MTQEIVKMSLIDSREIYERRKNGETGIWSATTQCKVCKGFWMWAVEDNLDFTCPNHE